MGAAQALCETSGQYHPSLPNLSQSHLSWQRVVASACENMKLRQA